MNNLLRVLDHTSLAQIFSYLNTSDVINLSLLCKNFHQAISSSPYILKSLFENLFGRVLTKQDMSNLSSTMFQDILKEISAHQTLRKPLPFFGFRGNCGCNGDNISYLFDKIFEFRGDNTAVSTSPGESFDIEGVLSEDYGRETQHIQSIIAALNQTDLMLNSGLYSLKGLLLKYGSIAVDIFPSNPDNLVAERVQSLQKLRQELSRYLKAQNDKYHIGLPCQKMIKSIGLIQSCRIRREMGNFTCPIKTLMAFASLNGKMRSSPLIYLFNDCKTSDDLIQLLEDYKDDLPDVTQTSIKKLAESSSKIKYIDEEEDGVEFVVFNSNGKMQDVIPLFWVNFTQPFTKDLFLNFTDENFSGRYVMLKLIQCEDLRPRPFSRSKPRNIQIKSCCFYGPVINL